MPASSEATEGLRASRVSCERGGKLLFAELDFHVDCGAALLVAGPNGSGKTTLLRALSGLNEPAAGAISWQGTPAFLRSPEWRMRIAYVGHKTGLKDDLTVAENFELACSLDGAQADEHARSGALERVGLGRRRSLQVKRLSQGQKQRLTLARLSLSVRPLWLLDEPTAALDAEARTLLSDILSAHLERGGVAIVATHDQIDLRGRRCAELRLN